MPGLRRLVPRIIAVVAEEWMPLRKLAALPTEVRGDDGMLNRELGELAERNKETRKQRRLGKLRSV